MSVIGNSPGVASQRVVSPFTATSGQTTFTPISGYTLGYCDVFLNGIKLANGDDYTAADGSTVVLSVGAFLGDFVEVVTYFPRGLSDGYLKAEADGRFLSSTDGSVTASKIAAGAVTPTKLSAGAPTWDASSNLSAAGFQLKLGDSGNTTSSITRGSRPSVGSSGISIYAGASTTVNDAAPAGYITMNSGPLGDTYEGGIGYHAYGSTSGSGYQNAHTWYRRTGVNTESISMQLNPSGTLILNDGQIKFPASQNASSGANTLDDYEEGTFTPIFVNGTFTYTLQRGNYTKVGNVVTIGVGIQWSASTGNGASIAINLPFVATGASGSRYTGSLGYVAGLTFAASSVPEATTSNGSSVINFFAMKSGTAPTGLLYTDLGASGEFQVSMTYLTD